MQNYYDEPEEARLAEMYDQLEQEVEDGRPQSKVRDRAEEKKMRQVLVMALLSCVGLLTCLWGIGFAAHTDFKLQAVMVGE